MFLGQKFAPVGYLQLSGSAGVLTGGSVSSLTGANCAVLSVSGNSVRYRDDGPTPTGAAGVLLPVGLFDFSGNMANLQFAAVAGAATVDVMGYKFSG
jgi:hypothetical protein